LGEGAGKILLPKNINLASFTFIKQLSIGNPHYSLSPELLICRSKSYLMKSTLGCVLGEEILGLIQSLEFNSSGGRRIPIKSDRLKGYDYSQAGAYFVTICTKDRECLLGEIGDGKDIE